MSRDDDNWNLGMGSGDGESETIAARLAFLARTRFTYSPESCCMCRWVMWNEDCGHPLSDGLDSPHDHCKLHGPR